MNQIRLQQYIRPKKYNINIEPIGPEYHYFKGKCYITYICDVDTNEIILHSLNLEFINVYILSNDKIYQNNNIIYDKNNEKVNLVFKTVPIFGILIIEYIGPIYDVANGLCRAKQNGEWVIYTHFEPIAARRCFPCFDEPNFKALFNIELLIPKNKFALSNTMVKEKIYYNGKILYKFDETPPMSTYIVAFYIGKIKHSEKLSLDGIKIRIFSNKPTYYRNYILDNVIKSMNIMTKYFDFKYPISKIDVIFVPILEGGAMENWGLIMVKQNDSDNVNNNIPPLYKINLTYTIIHEIVHQWFGNLVTMDWWSDLWLAESFATWFGWFIMNEFYPELKPYEYYYIEEVQKAYQTDCLLSSRAIKSDIVNLDQINEIFDAINYAKGSIIINMMVNYTGFNLFIKSIQFYIKKFQFANAKINDFIECMEYISKKPIGKMINMWITEKNYPIINVTIVGNRALYIVQEVFTLLKPSENENIIWTIPLTKQLILDKKSIIFPINKFSSKINKDAFAFYVVNYKPKIIRNLLNKFDQLTNLDIAEIMNNMFLCMRANKLSLAYYLEFLDTILKNLLNNKPTGLFTEMSKKHFFYFIDVVNNTDAINQYKLIITPYVTNILDILGTDFKENDDIDSIISRINCLNMACNLGVKKYIDYCNNLFDIYMYIINNNINTLNIINTYNEDIIIRNALINRTKNDRNIAFNFLIDLFENKNIKGLISNIVYTPDMENYKRALNLIFSDKIKPDEKLILITNAGNNRYLNKYLWYFIKENWDYISEMFDNTQFSLIRIVEAFSMIVDDGSLITDIETFFMNKDKNKIAMTLARTLEYITINTNFNNLFK